MHPLNRFFGVGEKQDTGKKDQSHQEEVVQIPVSEIQPNQYQPRSTFSQDRIEELAQTIHTHGMIQPIVIRKTDEDRVKYELIAGERRWRAAQHLNWEQIPAIVKDMTDTETASVALIENLQREELTVIEEAIAYGQLLEMHGLTQEALAQRLGKSQSTIANKLRLLKLPEPVQEAVLNKQITERHARALIALEEPELQEKLLKEILEKDLNVKQTEARIEQLKNPKPKKKSKPRVKGISKDIRIAMNTLRQSIHMVNDTGIELETDEEELDDYYQLTIKIPKKK
ncbi:nucleoid occlusion protein [Virgibacillus sp. MSP4-1]|uniref:nucleoid occlusion protein n=1 Tax=Virgibacillus sp. MSP4-1 TaxID=2700081 RepID=UPI0003A7A677|nr:nucleoid occlusion protein [Virgibacillus sp. MSP4-1]QHS23827.1 nucleoid occlusion protein [Virgibacillus sp. MSP4-1]